MPRTYKFLLHNERVLWPEEKPLEWVLNKKDITDTDVWAAGYQCDPRAEGGTIFLREWWSDRDARYDITDRALINTCVFRIITLDAAAKDKVSNDPSAYIVMELLPDYRVVIRKVWAGKVISADLPDLITALAVEWNRDEKLKSIVIEDTSGGTNAVQFLQLNSEKWLRQLIVPFTPKGSKEERARRITPFCKKHRILLPFASEHADWLSSFTEELFGFPGEPHDDRVDCMTMGADFLSLYLSDSLLSAGVSPDYDD